MTKRAGEFTTHPQTPSRLGRGHPSQTPRRSAPSILAFNSQFGARYSAPRISRLRRSILAFPLLLIYEMTTAFRLCFHSFCSQWQISTEVHWLSGLRSAKNKNKIRWTWLSLEHSSIRPSWHYWYEYIPETTEECTFWSCLQLTIAGYTGRVV